MLRYDRQTKPGLVALYDIRPGNGAGPYLHPGARTGLVSWLVFNSTFSTNRFYRATGVWYISRSAGGQEKQWNNILNQENYINTVRPGLCGDNPLAIGLLRGVFLASHLRSTDTFTRTTKRLKRHNTYHTHTHAHTHAHTHTHIRLLKMMTKRMLPVYNKIHVTICYYK